MLCRYLPVSTPRPSGDHARMPIPTAWAAGTNRPGVDYSYTANFPFDPLVGNRPLASALVWSIASVVLLILGIAVALYLYLRMRAKEPEHAVKLEALAEPRPTPSQRAALPYFLVAILLFIVQAVLGSVTGHFAVEGNKLTVEFEKAGQKRVVDSFVDRAPG